MVLSCVIVHRRRKRGGGGGAGGATRPPPNFSHSLHNELNCSIDIVPHLCQLTGKRNLHNNVFAHGTVTNDDDRRRPCVTIKGLGQLDQINTYQHLWGHQLGSSPSRTTSYPPAKLTSTYQIRGTKLQFHVSGFTLGNRGGLAPKIDST